MFVYSPEASVLLPTDFTDGSAHYSEFQLKKCSFPPASRPLTSSLITNQISAFEGPRQKYFEFLASLGYLVSGQCELYTLYTCHFLNFFSAKFNREDQIFQF